MLAGGGGGHWPSLCERRQEIWKLKFEERDEEPM